MLCVWSTREGGPVELQTNGAALSAFGSSQFTVHRKFFTTGPRKHTQTLPARPSSSDPYSSQFIGPKWPDTQPPVPRQPFAAGAFAQCSHKHVAKSQAFAGVPARTPLRKLPPIRSRPPRSSLRRALALWRVERLAAEHVVHVRLVHLDEEVGEGRRARVGEGGALGGVGE